MNDIVVILVNVNTEDALSYLILVVINEADGIVMRVAVVDELLRKKSTRMTRTDYGNAYLVRVLRKVAVFAVMHIEGLVEEAREERDNVDHGNERDTAPSVYTVLEEVDPLCQRERNYTAQKVGNHNVDICLCVCISPNVFVHRGKESQAENSYGIHEEIYQEFGE